MDGGGHGQDEYSRGGGQQHGAWQGCGEQTAAAGCGPGRQPLRHANPATRKCSMATCRRERQNVQPAHRSTNGTLRNTSGSSSGGSDRMLGFSSAARRFEWRVGARGASIAQHPVLVSVLFQVRSSILGPFMKVKCGEPCDAAISLGAISGGGGSTPRRGMCHAGLRKAGMAAQDTLCEGLSCHGA